MFTVFFHQIFLFFFFFPEGMAEQRGHDDRSTAPKPMVPWGFYLGDAFIPTSFWQPFWERRPSQLTNNFCWKGFKPPTSCQLVFFW